MNNAWEMAALPLSQSEQRLGITELHAFTRGSFAIVAATDVLGLNVSAHHAGPCQADALLAAKGSAVASLRRLRSQMWYCNQVAPTEAEAAQGVKVIHLMVRNRFCFAIAEDMSGVLGSSMKPCRDMKDEVATRNARAEAVRQMLYQRSRSAGVAS